MPEKKKSPKELAKLWGTCLIFLFGGYMIGISSDPFGRLVDTDTNQIIGPFLCDPDCQSTITLEIGEKDPSKTILVFANRNYRSCYYSSLRMSRVRNYWTGDWVYTRTKSEKEFEDATGTDFHIGVPQINWDWDSGLAMRDLSPGDTCPEKLDALPNSKLLPDTRLPKGMRNTQDRG